MAKQRVELYTCDNPKCDNSYVHIKDDPAPGYHITAGFWALAGGGPIPPTYACSIDCIKRAIEHRIHEES